MMLCDEMNLSDGAIVYRYHLRPETVYLNVTNRCSNSCSFCVRNFTPGLSGYTLWLDREPTADEVWSRFQDEVKMSDREVVWCGYGEPTMRLDTVIDLTERIGKAYPNLKVRLDTDGLAQLRNRNREVAKELRDAGIDSVSISLNAETEEKYKELCRPSLSGSYKAVLDFARDCKKYLRQVRLTVVNVQNMDIPRCRSVAENAGCDFKVRG
jgi:TatD family-associated radical SAM protein